MLVAGITSCMKGCFAVSSSLTSTPRPGVNKDESLGELGELLSQSLGMINDQDIIRRHSIGMRQQR
jgi:hypothetical protein